MDLVRELGLEDEVVHPAERRAYIWSRGALRPLPERHVLGIPLDLSDLEATGLLDQVELVETASAYDQPGHPVTADDLSVADLVAGACGRPVLDRVVAPLLGGINAGRVEDMSAATLTPQLLSAARHAGGLLAGLREQQAAADPRAPVFGSFVGGTQVLVDRLVERLRERDVTVVAGDPVGSLDALGADGVVVATPAFEAARLLELPTLAEIEYVSVALMTASVATADIERALDASGFLVARPEGLLLTACSWSSEKWTHLHREHRVILRASAGSADDRRVVELSDEDLAIQLLDELAATMGLAGPPSIVRISRWQRSLPQYGVGHAQRIAAIEADVPERVVLAGAAYRGVGIPACIHDGREAARRLLERLG
jgi:oxygen-dependent protoporphyrinogen oxidase